MKFLMLLIAFVQIAEANSQSQSWVRPPSDQALQALHNAPAVADHNIYEVVPTKIDTAVAWHLGKNEFAEISCEDANFLVGGRYTCEPHKKPILVRAAFIHGGTGKFTIQYKNTTLFIHHASLGPPGIPKKISLVIDLPSVPTAVFAWATSGAI